jgi:hypothetical protein
VHDESIAQQAYATAVDTDTGASTSTPELNVDRALQILACKAQEPGGLCGGRLRWLGCWLGLLALTDYLLL